MVKKTAREVTEDKTSRIMNAVALWASFYRANPQRFCKDYLNVNLKMFQQILIYCMALCTNFCFIAARGQLTRIIFGRKYEIYNSGLGSQAEKSA